MVSQQAFLFQYVASMVYEGDVEKDIRWSDVTKYWNLPSGDYFTVDSYPESQEN